MKKYLQKNLNDLLMNDEDYTFFGDPTSMDPEAMGDEVIYEMIEDVEPEDLDLDDLEIDHEGLSLI
jgi:hypothetical protein